MDSRSAQELLQAGIEQHKSGKVDEAERLYEEVLRQDPENADALHLSGLAAHQRGRNQPAADLISRAIVVNPTAEIFHFHLGIVRAAGGDLDGACKAYGKAIAIRPDYAEAYYNLGLLLDRQGIAKTARECYEAAIRINPRITGASVSLGNLHNRQGRLDEAARSYLSALAIQPDSFDACNNLGNVMLRLGRLDEAAGYYRRAIELNPGAIDPANNLGGALMRLGRHEEALRQLDKALSLQPDHPGTHFNKAWLLLMTGRFQEGWEEYEWRLQADTCEAGLFRRLAVCGRKPWDGTNGGGRRILVCCEQGLGDSIQFARYLPALREMRFTVLFCCQKELVPLLGRMRGIDCVLPEPPDGVIREPFDVYVSLLSLPRLMHTCAATIPSRVPYLQAGEAAVANWRDKLTVPGFKAGVVWAGRAANPEDWRRSCSPADFAPLSGIAGLCLFSLQKGDAAAQVSSFPPGMKVIDLGPELGDFAETAAVIESLDLVISVDTAVAHLAGALAKPVWTVLPQFPEWRWQLNRPDSPWYPTMRLYRQPTPGNWRDLFEELAADLNVIVSRHAG